MRTNLFLSTLFAVSLVGGAALAEKPHDAAKAPRAIEHLRAHGDTLDKTYRTSDKAPSSASSSSASTTTVTHTKSAVDKAASRINCSDSGADCAASHGDTHNNGATGAEASAKGSSYVLRAPAFLDKVLGSDRTNFNEAGEPEGMNHNAVKRAWSHAGAERGATGTIPLAVQKQNVRLDQEASSDRMSCNDADECMMSSKAAKKNWALNSIKAGTWQGPAAAPISNAERAIAEQKAAASKTAAKGADQTSHPQAMHHESEHQH